MLEQLYLQFEDPYTHPVRELARQAFDAREIKQGKAELLETLRLEGATERDLKHAESIYDGTISAQIERLKTSDKRKKQREKKKSKKKSEWQEELDNYY